MPHAHTDVWIHSPRYTQTHIRHLPPQYNHTKKALEQMSKSHCYQQAKTGVTRPSTWRNLWSAERMGTDTMNSRQMWYNILLLRKKVISFHIIITYTSPNTLR